MTLPAAKPALIVGLRTLGFLRLASDFDSHALLVDLLAVHLFDCALDCSPGIEDLGGC